MATEYADLLLADGDLVIDEDVSVVDTNLLSLKQRLDLRFAIWQGEWKYDESYGTPYRDYIGLSVDKSSIDQEIKRQILKETDVVELSGLYSVINKQLRLYTFIAEVSTNEATLTYSLNLKDSFEYEIPKYSSGCDKIVEYQYWSSAPYDILSQDFAIANSYQSSGSLFDRYKLEDNLSVTDVKPLSSGIMMDIAWTYTQPNEDFISADVGFNLNSVALDPSIIYRTYTEQDEDKLSADVGFSLQTLTRVVSIIYTTQDQTPEDFMSADVGMTLTSLTLVKTI